MSNAILVIGESGTGKSTGIKTLNPKETFVINVLGKDLPFRGWKKNYTVREKEKNPDGNMYCTMESSKIIEILNRINQMGNIKNIVIDDFGYTMSGLYMDKAYEKGFDKFTKIGKNAWDVLKLVSSLRSDINCFVIMHSDNGGEGLVKPKTIGKMLDEKVCVEGMFTVVLHAMKINKDYKLITNNDGVRMAKSPSGMFEEMLIDNDYGFVLKKIEEYNNGDEEDSIEDDFGPKEEPKKQEPFVVKEEPKNEKKNIAKPLTTDELRQLATQKSKNGAECFREFWQGLTPRERGVLGPYLEEYKAAAEAAA